MKEEVGSEVGSEVGIWERRSLLRLYCAKQHVLLYYTEIMCDE